MKTDTVIEEKIAKAKPGDRVAYWIGDLAYDCLMGRVKTHARIRRHTAWAAYVAGSVCLVQERVKGSSEFAYFAIKRKKPEPLPKWHLDHEYTETLEEGGFDRLHGNFAGGRHD